MKKLLAALAFVLTLTGCSSTPKEPTLDLETYVSELENTELTAVKIDYLVGVINDEEVEAEGRLTAEDGEVHKALVNALKELTLTKAEDQAKIYGSATLYIDLNGVIDENYARIAVYEGDTTKVVILTNDGYVNYDLADATQLDTLKTTITDRFLEEAE